MVFSWLCNGSVDCFYLGWNGLQLIRNQDFEIGINFCHVTLLSLPNVIYSFPHRNQLRKYAILVLIIDWNVEPQSGHGWICSTAADLCLAPSLPLCFSQTRHKDPFIRLLPHGLKVLSDSEAVCWQKRQTTCEIFSFAVLWLVLRQLLAILYISKYKVLKKYSVKLICIVLFKIHV